MVDSTVLIDFYRKTDKSKARLTFLFKEYDQLFISAITEFEVLYGVSANNMPFWNDLLSKFIILDLDSLIARESARIVQQLKISRKSIEKPDLFIAATAVVNGLTLETANKKHFVHISNLSLLPD